MIKRAMLYIFKNFSKLLSTIVLSIVIVSLVSTLVYVFVTIDDGTSSAGYSRRNYTINEEILFSFSEESADSYQDLEMDVEDVYSNLTSQKGLEAYSFDLTFYMGMSLPDYDDFFEFKIANDEKEIDFFLGNKRIIDGDFGAYGLVINSEFAERENVSIGDKIKIGTDMLSTFDEETFQLHYAFVKEIEVIGIYANEESESLVSNMMYTPEYMYISLDAYNDFKEEAVEFSKQHSDNLDLLIPEGFGTMDIARVLVQYDNEESANFMDEYFEEEYDHYIINNSTEDAKKSLSPLIDFRVNVIYVTIAVVLISMIALYLNMYLKFEKRTKEYISLISFGVSNIKLVIQTFIEQIVLVAISIPFSFLIVKSLIPSIIEVLQKYFYMILNGTSGGSGDIDVYSAGMFYSHMDLDVDSFLNFNEPNLLLCFGIAILVVAISVGILCLIEVFRRFRRFSRV